MSDSTIVVTPGETIARESGTFSFIRGHGTYTVTTASTTQFAPGLSNNEDEDGVDDRVEEVPWPQEPRNALFETPTNDTKISK